jgi:competence protein ComEC
MIERGRSRGRAEAWRPWIAAGRRPALAWPHGLTDFVRRAAQRVREWAAVEAAPGRLVPWLAIGFGSGTIIYFAVEREPALSAAALLLAATVAAAILCRRRPFAFPACVGVAAVAAGFATGAIKREIIAHPVLSAAAWNVELAGFVEVREERERSDRVVVRLERMSGPRLSEHLERVRVSVRKGTAPAVGSFIEFKARLSPPLEPLRPGGYDFARDMYFQRIGASGFVLGSIRTVEAPHAPGLRLRFSMLVDGTREAIDKRIRTILPGDNGAIASALITGKRDTISTPVNEAMYVSGLAHVLSISGYHMAVVAGIMFFTLRALFALMPAFGNRHPIKKCVTAVEMSWVFRILLPNCYQSPPFQGRSHRCINGRGSVLLH